MRLQRPQLPQAASSTGFDADLVFKLKQQLTLIVDQLNNLTEGRIAAVQNATTAAPTSGTYQIGDFVRNSAPAELGTAGYLYVVTGWLCTASGTPGTFKEMRCLTGN